MTPSNSFPVYSLQFWRDYFIQMRPYLLFISGIAGASGMAISANETTPQWKLVFAFVPFFLGYGFGQALTDCFQTDTDKLSAPYRPLSKGTISIRAVLFVSLTGLTLSGILLLLLHPLSLWLCLLSVFGLATYSYIKKNFSLAGPFYNAWIVALLPIMGYFTSLPAAVKTANTALYLSAALSFFSYANFVLMGYLKDIEADRATGYKTFPVIFGWNKTIFFGDILALITLSLFWIPGSKNNYELIFGIGGSAAIVFGQIYAHLSKQKDEKGALFPILSTVRCFILLHLAKVTQFQPEWWMYAALFYILFEITLYMRPSRYQV
jgi:geranylgeranylglycerol-phosphate geranylgeranyltransferase